jgi:hypothetical protein
VAEAVVITLLMVFQAAQVVAVVVKVLAALELLTKVMLVEMVQAAQVVTIPLAAVAVLEQLA